MLRILRPTYYVRRWEHFFFPEKGAKLPDSEYDVAGTGAATGSNDWTAHPMIITMRGIESSPHAAIECP